MSRTSTLNVTCPTCQAQVAWSSDSEYRPFCSHRCKLIDLGAWASETHRIPGEHAMDETAIDELVLHMERQNAKGTL